MKLRAQNYVLGLAAVLCFGDSFLAPHNGDPGPVLTAVMGILLIRRAIIVTPQSAFVILAGCVLATLMVMGNHSFVNTNAPVWMGVILVAFIVYGFWERIKRLARRHC